MPEGRDKKGRFAKGNKIGNRFKANGEQTEIARKGAAASNAVQRKNRIVRDAVAAYIEQASSRQGKTKLDDFIEKILLNVFNNPMADIGQLERLQRVLGEDPSAPPPQEAPPALQASQAADQRIAQIRAYLEQEKHLTEVDEMTLELLRYDLATLDFINSQLDRSMTTVDRYGAQIPSQFLRERDRVIKRIMEYEKKLGLSPYDRKKLNAGNDTDQTPLDKFLNGDTTEIKMDEL